MIVCCRVRPETGEEVRDGKNVVKYADDLRGISMEDEEGGGLHGFAFHRVFREAETQDRVFADVGVSLVESVLAGENASVICYGQTSSGKTFTMLGPPIPETRRCDYRGVDRGLVPRMIELLFASISMFPAHMTIRVRVQFIEIYNEEIYDLLLPTKVR